MASSLFLTVAAASFAAVMALGTPPVSSVWPMPQNISMGSSNIQLAPSFAIKCASICPDPMTDAVQRYSSIIFFGGASGPASGTVLSGLVLNIAAEAPLKLGADECYTLTVPANGANAVITAKTQWGALRALETFSQLVSWSVNGQSNVYTINTAPVSISDFPRFQWRGVLIDSSRHYLTVASIKTVLDAMSYNKMNRLHWHVVDDNSWPLASTSYPNFTIGAYAPDAIYTHADVQDIVQYAFNRGIAVIPEFDLPAHASAWGRGYPELTISCASGQTLVDPTDTGLLYSTVEGLLQEFVPLFNTDFIHFGGDEVEDFTCWEQSAEVQAFAKRMNFATMNEVRNYLEMRLQTIAAKYSLSPMFWEEVYDQGYTLNADAIVDVWLSDDELINVIKGGNRVVESYGLYLDQQTPAGATHYFWVDTFLNFYLHDPLFNRTDVTPQQAALVMGMSASQWGEQVDASNIQSRMWPRACAAAERMWSAMEIRDTTAVFPRIEAMRCHMVQRGIGAGPVRPADQVGYCALPKDSRFAMPHNPWTK